MGRYELKLTQEFSDHVVVDAESEAEALCLVEDAVAEGAVSVVGQKGVKGGGWLEYDAKAECLYETEDPATYAGKNTKEGKR